MTLEVPSVRKDDWTRLRIIIDKLKHNSLGVNSHPKFAGLALTDLTASALIGINASKIFESVTIGSSLDYTRPTLDTIQDIRTTASPIFAGLIFDGAEFTLYSTSLTKNVVVYTGDGDVTIPNGIITAGNYTAVYRLTACATYAGELDFTAADKKLDVEDNAVVSQDYSVDAGPTFGGIKLGNAGLHLLENADPATHYLIIAPGSALSANRVLSLITGDAARVITLLGNPTLADWFDQSVKVAATPTLASLNLTTNTGLLLVDGTTFLADDGTRNLFLGADVFDNDSGSYNIGIGFEAGKNNDTTGVGEEGDASIYIGYRAGYGGTGGTDNTGYGNIAIGSASLYLNTSGYHNVGIGRSSLYDNTTGDFNMAIGAYACKSNLIGDRNVAIGFQTLYYNEDGFDNTAIGEAAGRGTSGQSQWWNVLIGRKAGYSIQAAHGNVCIGYQSGQNLTAGDYNIFVGFNSGYRQTTLGNLFIVDNLQRADAATEITNAILYGVMAATPAAQSLRINAEVTVTDGLILDKTSGSGIKVDLSAPTFGWRDLKGKITNSKGATKPSEITYREGITQFQFGAGDDAGLEYHIPHDYVPGTDIHLHVHWSHISGAVTGGNVVFTYEITYCKGHNQAAFPATVTGTIIGTASATQYKHIISEGQISISTGSGTQIDTDDLEPDGLVLCRIEMTTNNMTGATPDPFIHEVDVHYQSTNLGTKQKAPDFYT